MMFVRLKHVEYAVLGVLIVVSRFYTQFEVLLDLLKNVCLHREPAISSFIYFHKVLTEFDALLLIFFSFLALVLRLFLLLRQALRVRLSKAFLPIIFCLR